MYKNFLLIINIFNDDKKVFWYETEAEILTEIEYLKDNKVDFNAYDLSINRVFQIDGFKEV